MPAALGLDPIAEQLQRRPRRTDDPQRRLGSPPERLRPLVDLNDHGHVGQELRIGVVGADHEQEIAVHDRVIRRPGADHADPAHPMRIVVRHKLLALDRVDQRRLEPIRQGAEFIGGAMAASAAHDQDMVCEIDPIGDLVDVVVARDALGRRLQGYDARDGTFCARGNDVLRQRQVSDAAAGVSGGDRLMHDMRRLRRRGHGFRIERHVAEQQIRLSRLDVVDAAELPRHVARQGQDRRVVARGFVEAGDQMCAAGAGGSGADGEPSGQLGLTRGGQRRPLLVADADPFNRAAPNCVGEGIERVANETEDMPDADLLKRSNQHIRNRSRHPRLLTR